MLEKSVVHVTLHFMQFAFNNKFTNYYSLGLQAVVEIGGIVPFRERAVRTNKQIKQTKQTNRLTNNPEKALTKSHAAEINPLIG